MLDSLTSWLILVVVVVVLFGGASKIPDLARGIGRAVGEFKRGRVEIEKEIQDLESTMKKEEKAQ